MIGQAALSHINCNFWRCYMKEDKGSVMDATGMAKPDNESKIKKHIRTILGFIGICFFVFLFVMIAYRKYGG
jgi:hypothetical protein